ncbi:translation initiation factor IF-2 [Desulfovermiculus halophilus]|uniref:translation initiation factor IF-2 n=1 Tax=Desulfovermiculus halophilus TaxID=339722 RepID=UPI000488AC99|nr:translation initiation factor IF-2 [Desulfovermiculus halophilus]
MNTKMRVRELSAELGLSNKELLHILREENIQVKSHMSGLSDEQVESVRAKVKDHAGDHASQDKVTPSGVIVRRRRGQRKKAHEAESDGREQEAVSPVSEGTEPPGPEAGPEQPEAEPEVPVQPEPEQPPAAESGEVSPRQPAGPDQSHETSAVELQAEQPPTSPEEPSRAEPTPPAGSEPEESAAGEHAPAEGAQGTEPQSEAKPGKKKRGRRKKKETPPPQVTVISRPEAAPEPEAPPAAPAGEESAGKDQEKQGKKRKKDKRTVDVSGLYTQDESRQGKGAKKQAEAPEKPPRGKGRRKKPTAPQARKGPKPQAVPQPTQPLKAAKRKIRMEEAIRVADLAQEMGIKAQDIIKSLFNLGVMTTINQSLDVDTATLVASEFGYEVEKVGFSEEEYVLPQKEDNPEELMPRPPVVTIMGHVDHGKTSLLDAIRKSHVMDSEAGGITQHIGAYHVQTEGGTLVFLDTPGHEAFTEMRSRGAQVTDVVILIVAADDGVMDQTKEAVNHAKAAQVPIIVAVNKIDKDNADPDRVKRELADLGLIPEEWGGETIYAYISAKQRIGLSELLEMVLLQTEVLELKANPAKRARGHIVEAKLDKGRGPVGTVLIQEGTLRTSDPFVCGLYSGRARALFNDMGQKIDEAGPSMPVEVQGFEGVPNAGDEFVVVENDKVAKRIAETRQAKHRERELAKETKVTLESFFAAKAEEEIKNLNLILKADVQGSLEAITESLQKQGTSEVKVNIIHGGIGAITESDIKLASASAAVIIGFNVRPTAKVKDLADQESVDIRFYNVIYHLVNEVKEAMAGMLAPVTKEEYLGQAEVRDIFSVPKVGTVAGCFVLDGKLQRNAGIRLLRDGVVIYTGKLSSLKRFKDDVKEVTKDYECGVGLEKFNDIKAGDIIEAFSEFQEKATLE